MKSAMILIALMVAFGVVGRMDYETELAMQQERAEYAQRYAAKVASAEYRK